MYQEHGHIYYPVTFQLKSHLYYTDLTAATGLDAAEKVGLTILL